VEVDAINIYRARGDVQGERIATLRPDGYGGGSFRDEDVSPGTDYHYWLEVATLSEVGPMLGPWSIILVPWERAMLLGSQPNPLANETAIRFFTPAGGPARLAVYAVAGRRVRSMDIGEAVPGVNSVIWDGRDDEGRPVANGRYLYQVGIGPTTLTGQLIVLR
jgi:hypothetical protein